MFLDFLSPYFLCRGSARQKTAKPKLVKSPSQPTSSQAPRNPSTPPSSPVPTVKLPQTVLPQTSPPPSFSLPTTPAISHTLDIPTMSPKPEDIALSSPSISA